MESYDVAVIGGGHAGVEAALAAARMGCDTILFTLSLDQIAKMPCNPSIGGTAKGHLVREIDALGGEMGKAADKAFIQSRMLNRGKGPAVHSLRAQVDRSYYHTIMKQTLENQSNLLIQQDEITELKIENGKILGIYARLTGFYSVKTAILCCGTYLNGKIFVGEIAYSGGPDYSMQASFLGKELQKIGIPIRRFKTGTPARIHARSIDFSKLEEQKGDNPVIPFSFTTKEPLQNRALCHIAYTNEKTHHIIHRNLHRSPLYQGKIEGQGPRYCPSIEDKVVRFADKSRHQIFVEPMGLHTNEIYLQGMSSSLPAEVQEEFIHSIVGFENAKIMRTGYAIEYDCCDSLCLNASLQVKAVEGLFGAGQFNGTSGYEEAAAQGLIAGINAALLVKKKNLLELPRSSSYIGTLIDDLVTKGCTDPYRMMTSRSEYRLILRQDNADERLTPIGYALGLIDRERYERFLKKREDIQIERRRVKEISISPSKALNEYLVSRGTTAITQSVKEEELLRRPQTTYDALAPFDETRPKLSPAVTEQVEISIKYEGYIQKQEKKVKQMESLENKRLSPEIDYHKIEGLRLEAREKLASIRPTQLGQASRIPGVTPADITVLNIWIEQNKRFHHANKE